MWENGVQTVVFQVVPGRETNSQTASGNAAGGTGEQEFQPGWELNRVRPPAMYR